MPNDTIPASAPALPSRRFFLGRATAGLAGGLVAAAAVAQPSLAALPSAAAPESDDPIFALIEEHARAHEFSNARDTANDDAEETDRRTGIADDLLLELVQTKPTGIPGAARLLDYVRAYDIDYGHCEYHKHAMASVAAFLAKVA